MSNPPHTARAPRRTPATSGRSASASTASVAAAWAARTASMVATTVLATAALAQPSPASGTEAAADLPASPPAMAPAGAGTGPGAIPAAVPSRGVERLPLWEAGAGIAALSLPDWRGAARRSVYALPLPYVVWRGEFLRADRDGARAVFVENDRFDLNVSVSASPPVRRTDEGARQGMARLPGTVEVGPTLDWKLWRDAADLTRLELRLPLRGIVTLERSPRYAGLVAHPVVNVDRRVGRWNVGVQTGPRFGDARAHDFVYGVDASEATAQRPAYAPGGGYAGWQSTAALSARLGSMWVGAFVRHDSLAGAAFAASPLVQRRSDWTAGVGVSWIFAQSATLVDAPRER